jgi:hypothetical protein
VITEKEVSKLIGREIKSPICVSDLEGLGIDKNSFLAFFRPFFEKLKDDCYLIRQKQMLFLEQNLPDEFKAINALHKDYFEGNVEKRVLEPWILKLNDLQKASFDKLAVVTRQRSISTFTLSVEEKPPQIKRIYMDEYHQDVDDFRVWKRVFEETDPAATENDLFRDLLIKTGELVINIHPEVKKLKFTAHFMRTLAQKDIPGENAPEGIHEDGAQYIISALVINRLNVEGGASGIYEKPACNNKALIYSKVLQSGEFVFQADTGEELTFGNDLWHNVTAIHPVDTNQKAFRDIIGLDIEILV